MTNLARLSISSSTRRRTQRAAPPARQRRALPRCARSSFAAPGNLVRGRWLIQRGQILLKLFQFRQVVVDDVGLIRMQLQVVLMVVLGRVEAAEWNYLGNDRPRECVLLIELRDVVIGHLLLRVVRIENRRPVLRPGI